MDKLIIHAGLHKTGSSAIQATLNKNRDFLWENGYFYPDPSPFEAHHELASRLIHAPNLKEGIRDAEETLAIHKQLAEGRTVLLSSEMMSEQLDPACFSTLPSIFNEIQIVFYVRQQDDLRESAYNQQVKQSGEYRAIDEYQPYRWDLYEHLKGFSDAIEGAEVFALEYNHEVFVGENLVADFFERVLSLPFKVYKSVSNITVNQSFSSVTCAIMARLNKLPLEERLRLKVLDVLMSTFPIKNFKKYSLLSDDFRMELVSKSESSNKKLRRDYLRSGQFIYNDKGKIFLDGFNMNKIVQESLIVQKLSTLLDDQYDLNHILKF